MPQPPEIPPIPAASPASRLVPGKSRSQVARALKISVAEVERHERLALAKCYAEMTRRGLSLRDFFPLLNLTRDHTYHAPKSQDHA